MRNSVFTEKWYFSLNSKRKYPKIWNKFINFQKKCLGNSLPIKFEKCKFLQELCFNKVLLKQGENLPFTCAVCKAEVVSVACSAIFKLQHLCLISFKIRM